MIVNEGKLLLQTAQLTYLGTLEYGLFVTDVPILDATVLGDLTEAAWAGYARQPAGVWAPPTLVGKKARTLAAPFPTFGNTSGVNQTFYGWFLLDPLAVQLVAAFNQGARVIPNIRTFSLRPVISDQDIAD